MLSLDDYEKFKSERSNSAEYDVQSLLSVGKTMQFQQEQATSDMALNIGKSLYNGAVSQTVGGVLRGFQWLRDVNEAQLNAEHPERQQMDDGMRQLLDDAANAEFLQPYEVRADSGIERFAYDLAQGAGQLAGQVAIGAATGGYGNLPAMALQIGGEEYKELREQGVDVETAGTAAAINAAVQTPLEYLGFSKITKAFPANTMMKQRVRLLLEDAITEGVTEFAQEYPEQISKLWALNADKTPEEITQIVKDNINNMSADALYSGTIGAILGSGAGGLHMALDRNIQRAMAREAHSVRMDEEMQRIEKIKQDKVNPAYAAVVINDNMQNETVYVDGETLQGYAQEKGIEKVAESLGVTVEDIEKAAADGDTVDVKIGNFEATGAAFDGFMDAVKDDTAFEDGGYTPNQDKLEQEWAKKYQAQEQTINTEEDRLFNEMREAGVNKQTATEGLALLRARAVMTDDPAEFLKKLSFQAGGDAGNGYQQFAGENAETADKVKLADAQKMESEGKSADEIYKATGWFKGKDNKWRFEIKDDLDSIDLGSLGVSKSVPLGRIYYNPDLYDAYPWLRLVSVQATTDINENYYGETAYDEDGNVVILLNQDMFSEGEHETKLTLVHEIAHVIQDVENFATGGTAKYAREALAETGRSKEIENVSDNEIYKRLGGEEEAREVERRAEIEKDLADKSKEADAAKAQNDKKKYFMARLSKEGLLRKSEAMPRPHSDNAIIIFDGQEISYSPKQNEALTPQQSLEAFLQAAWHGSPHKFAKFDLGAIGTGEGAQVHGWGLYFAQNREIAEQYKESLDRGANITIEGNEYRRNNQYNWENKDTGYVVPNTSVFELALTSFSQANGDVDKAINSLQKDVVLSQKSNEEEWWITNLQNAIKFLQRHGATWKLDNQTAQLYQVEIPDNDVLLDEQKTFEEQPEKVQAAIKKLLDDYVSTYHVVKEGDTYAVYDGERQIDGYNFESREDAQEIANLNNEAKKERIDSRIPSDKLNDMTGREIYSALARILPGSDRAASELLNQYGVEGITYEGGRDGRCFVVFDDAAINIIDTYNQQVNGGEAETKGAYNPNTNIITLFNGADASTVIHETWHFFVEQMWNSVQDGTASAQTIKDFDTLLGYAGMTRDEWKNADGNGRRAAHERLAEAGETYIMEGKSPSFELRRVFQKFAEWLKSVYRTLQRSENAAELTDEVREVFDRMLAAEDDIAHMERVNGYFAKLPDVITDNMSEATKMRVENFIDKARDKAVEMLTRRALKNYTKERREEVKKFKEEIRPSVEDEVSKRRVYACGYDKNDADRFQKMQKQKADTDEDFMFQAQITAEQYGYSSADEMMKDIEASPTKEQAIKQRINERVEELSGENEKENYASAIREALYNEDEALLIGVEQQLIENYAAKAKEQQVSAEIAAARKQQAKNAARADLAKMTVKEATRTNKFITAERRAAAKCAELLAKKKFDEALTQKNLQAYWHAMAAESIKIAKRQKQYEKFLKTQVKLKPEAWLNETNFAAVSQLFTRMGIARPVHMEAAGNTEYPTLAAYADAMEQLYDCVDIAPWILDESIPLSDTNALTLEQYEDVVNAVKNIKAIVKAQKGVDTFNRQETWANTKALMMEKLSALKTIWTPNPNKPTKASQMERFIASMENLDTFLEFMDNATYGFFSKTFGNAIKHASDKEYEYREQYDKADAEALKKWLPDAAAESASNEEVYYDELGNSVTKHTLVKMLINLGNKENAQRLCETVPVGFERSTLWIMPDEITDRQTAAETTKQNLIDFLGRVLTKEDVEYAQRKIDAAEMFWGEKNELEKRVKGFGLKKVEATPVELMINGEAVVLRGGYFPLMRNGETGSHAATAEVQDDDPLQGKRIRTYHTNTSATKARTQARYPVNLFPGAETQWIYESIHDLCWRETMNDFRRVLNDQELFSTMKSKIGAARMQVFKEMLEVCADPKGNSKSVSEFEKLLGDQINWLRQRVSHAAIMLNLKVIAQNYANALLYGNAIEGYTMADNLKAIGTYMLKYHGQMATSLINGGQSEMVDFVFSKSSFLRERCELPDITVRDIVNEKKEFAWEKAAREIGIKAMAMTDNATAIPNWLTAYNKKLSEGALEQEAIDYADALVRRVLGSSRITDVASMQRGGALAKALTMFQSFFNARLGEFLRMERLASKQWTNGQKMEAFANVASYVVYKWLGQTMLAMALALQNPLGVDDDDKWPELVKELKSYSFSMMGPVGQLGNALAGSIAGMHEYTYRMSAIESTIENVNRSIKRIHSDKATTQDKLEGITNTVTLFAGVPAQLNRIFWNTVDIVLNGMKPEVGDIMRRRPKKERK